MKTQEWRGYSVRALLVEDEALVALVAEDVLLGLGFQVETVGTGQSALDALARHSVDLVVMDVGLPDMDGDALVESVLRAAPDASILIVSGRAASEIVVPHDQKNRVAFVSKPYSDSDLADAIQHQASAARAPN